MCVCVCGECVCGECVCVCVCICVCVCLVYIHTIETHVHAFYSLMLYSFVTETNNVLDPIYKLKCVYVHLCMYSTSNMVIVELVIKHTTKCTQFGSRGTLFLWT